MIPHRAHFVCVAFAWAVWATSSWGAFASEPTPEEHPKILKQWRLGAADIDPVVVAVLLPLSGKHKGLGAAALDGLRWASLWIEVPILFLVYDTQADAEVAVKLTTALREKPEISAVLGPLGHQTARAAAAVAAPLPMLTLSSADGVEGLGLTTFRARVSAEDQARGMATLMVEALHLQRAAVAFPDDDYGRSCALAFSEALEAAGGEVVAYEAYLPGQTKLQGVARRVFGGAARTATLPSGQAPGRAKPQAIFIPDDGAQVVRLLPFFEAEGGLSEVQLLGLSSWQGEALRLAGGRAVGALVPMAFDERASEEVEAAVASFEEAFQRAPAALEAQTHDALMLLAQAIKRCGGVTLAERRGCIAQRLQSGEAVDGLTGHLSLTPARGPTRDLYIFQVDAQGQLWPAY